MIRNLLATTAIATLVATGAAAQMSPPAESPSPQAAPAQPEQPMVKHAEGDLASNLIGETVYNGTGEEAENIGQVTDLVIDKDGSVKAIIVGVGGFLGVGQKEVALEYGLVERVQRDNDEWLVVETTADALKAQEEFDRSAYEPMPADADVTETEPATEEDLSQAAGANQGEDQGARNEETSAAPADETSPAGAAAITSGAGGGDQAAATSEEKPKADQSAAEKTSRQAATGDEKPEADASANGSEDMAASEPQDETATDRTKTGAVDKSGLKEMPTDKIRSEELVGATVYGANDQEVGEIGDIVLTENGDVDAVLVDVGGFLGVGEKPVALAMDNLQFMTDDDGNILLYTSITEEELKNQPAYDEATYADKRDEMRMTVD